MAGVSGPVSGGPEARAVATAARIRAHFGDRVFKADDNVIVRADDLWALTIGVDAAAARLEALEAALREIAYPPRLEGAAAYVVIGRTPQQIARAVLAAAGEPE